MRCGKQLSNANADLIHKLSLRLTSRSHEEISADDVNWRWCVVCIVTRCQHLSLTDNTNRRPLTGETECEKSTLRTCTASDWSVLRPIVDVTGVHSVTTGSRYNSCGICPAFASVPLLDFLELRNRNVTLDTPTHTQHIYVKINCKNSWQVTVLVICAVFANMIMYLQKHRFLVIQRNDSVSFILALHSLSILFMLYSDQWFLAPLAELIVYR